MSNYRNFVKDFPNRCRDLLQKFSEEAVRQDREVTLLLMAAAAGLVISYERLSEGTSIVQPPLDRPLLASAVAQLKTMLSEGVAQSQTFKDQLSSWHGGLLHSAKGMPDEWPECQRPPLLNQADTVGCLISTMRNALAHGNVLTLAGESGQIAQIVLVSGGTKRNGAPIPLRFLMLTPTQLHAFLLQWFDYLLQLQLPPEMVMKAIDEVELQIFGSPA